MELTNNNKLIAEFMGYEVKYGKCYSPKYNDGTIAPMQFDRSWDWLMPVVESCFERLDARDNSADEIKRQLLVCNLRGVHTAVVEFINEYNKYICGSCGDHVNEVVLNEDTDVDECTNCTEYYER
jgi:hypothetical protein